MSTYTPPEGFILDPNSELYYMRTQGVDPQTGAHGEYITWFYPDSGQYQQQFYPSAPTPPPTINNPVGATTPGHPADKSKKPLIACLAAILVLAVVIGLFIIRPRESSDSESDSNIPIESELTSQPDEQDTLHVETSGEDTGDDAFVMAVQQLGEIPYFGDRSILNLTAEQAQEYAQVVENAECTFGFENYDRIIPMLIDVSNDGVPLLLIIPYGEELQNAWPVFSFYLLGFNNGKVQEICRTGSIAIVTVDNENLLCAYIDSWDAYHDFGQFSLYRINNGTAELISELNFDKFYPIIDEDTDIGDETLSFKINGENVSEDVFEQVVGGFRSIISEGSHLVRMRTHYGHNLFEENDLIYEYLRSPFSRDQVKQAFINYANVMTLSKNT